MASTSASSSSAAAGLAGPRAAVLLESDNVTNTDEEAREEI